MEAQRMKDKGEIFVIYINPLILNKQTARKKLLYMRPIVRHE